MAERTHADITSTAQIVYILYFVGLAVGITGLIGVIMAYVKWSDAPEWLASHYRFQIHTFWIGLLYAILVIVLSPITFVVRGYAVMAVMMVMMVLGICLTIWWIIRCVKGLQYLAREEAYPDPEGWLF